MTSEREGLSDRFWAKVYFDGPLLSPYLGKCWLWTGALSQRSYGSFSVHGRQVKAHVFAYEALHGAVPRRTRYAYVKLDPKAMGNGRADHGEHRCHLSTFARLYWVIDDA